MVAWGGSVRGNALSRSSMRFLPIKSAEQQDQLMQHRTRDVLIPSGRCWPIVAPIGRLSLLKLPRGARRGREEEM